MVGLAGLGHIRCAGEGGRSVSPWLVFQIDDRHGCRHAGRWQLPSLPLPLIHKVIAFYLENQSAVDVYAANCQSEVDRQRAAALASPDLQELRRRMAALSRTSTP